MRQNVFYHAIYRTPEKVPPAGGLMCDEATSGPPRTVLWNHLNRAWEYNRRVGARFLFDEEARERKTVVSRSEAERIAREELGTELPTEAEIHQIVLAGEAALPSS